MRLTAARNVLIIVIAATTTRPVVAEMISYDIPGILRKSYTNPLSLLVPKFNPALGTLESVTLEINPEISGTIEGTATGPANTANGWVVEFAGKLRLSGPGFDPAFQSASFPTRGGTVFQPNTPIFEFFGPSVRPISPSPITPVSGYIGSGNATLTLSWPEFSPLLFFSRSGRLDRTTRDLGAQTGKVTYQFAVPEPATVAMTISGLALLIALRWRRGAFCRERLDLLDSKH